MRIIGGEHRGRRIEAPPGQGTRPMLDRVREAMFSTLLPWLDGARVLDLFAGSGSLGLEALSRGAERAVFVEQDERVLDIVRANLALLGLEERADVIRGDALLPVSWQGTSWADIVFLDPPYPMLKDPELRPRIFEVASELLSSVTNSEGVVVFHTPRRTVRPDHFNAIRSEGLDIAERVYGSNALWYLQHGGA